jgi:predicted peroxiredoxin
MIAVTSAATRSHYALAPEISRSRAAADRDAGLRVWCMASGSLVVKATAGKNDPERCNQAFTVAATAAASGIPVSLWLTGEATLLALPGQADDFRLPYASPLTDLLEAVLKSGSVTVCTQCAARREITQDDLIEGVRIAGAPTFVAEVLADGARALVY